MTRDEYREKFKPEAAYVILDDRGPAEIIGVHFGRHDPTYPSKFLQYELMFPGGRIEWANVEHAHKVGEFVKAETIRERAKVYSRAATEAPAARAGGFREYT